MTKFERKAPVPQPGRANGPDFSRRTDYEHHLPGPKRAGFGVHAGGVVEVRVKRTTTFLPEREVRTSAVYMYLFQRLLAT